MNWGALWSGLSAGAKVASAGAQIYTAVQQERNAKQVHKDQAAEYRRQQMMESARAKRDARIRTAQLQASQGRAGVTSSMGSAGAIGIGSSLQFGLSNLAEATDYNIGSSKMQYRAQRDQSIATGVLGVASFAAGGKEFSDWLGTTDVSAQTQSLAQTQEQYPLIARRN